MRSRSPFVCGLLCTFVLAGCDILDPIITTGHSSDPNDTTDATVTSTGTSTGDPDPGTTSGAVTTAVTWPGTSEGDSNDSAVFIVPPDPPPVCDVWAQDCPAGQKCSAHGPWPPTDKNIACIDIVDEPAQLGEPCQVLVEGDIGPETCDIGLFCWNVDPGTGAGTCISLCQDNPADPVCSPGYTCAFGLVFPLCIAECDPLLSDCPAGQFCRHGSSSGFQCYPAFDPPTQQLFEPCAHEGQCQAGHACAVSAAAAECDQNQPECCLPWCDLGGPNTCPGAGQVCRPWSLPPGYEHVGVCSLPL